MEVTQQGELTIDTEIVAELIDIEEAMLEDEASHNNEIAQD